MRNVKDFDAKLGIFKEAFGLRSEAQGDSFILSAEKQSGGDNDGVGLDFGDCTTSD